MNVMNFVSGKSFVFVCFVYLLFDSGSGEQCSIHY